MMAELCLVLLLDTSSSVPPDLREQVARAHVAGLRDQRVQRHAEAYGVAVTVVAFGTYHRVEVPWMPLQQAATALEARADSLHDLGGTAAGEAVFAALALMERGPDCERHIIDLAGDGEDNAGRSIRDARDEAAARGVQINAVVFRSPMGHSDPVSWARENAATPGGFVIGADSEADWLRAIQRKLVAEVASR